MSSKDSPSTRSGKRPVDLRRQFVRIKIAAVEFGDINQTLKVVDQDPVIPDVHDPVFPELPERPIYVHHTQAKAIS